MSYQFAPFFFFIAMLIILIIFNEKLNPTVSRGIVILAFLFLLAPFFPRHLLGKWNSISTLDHKVISAIQLQPSAPAAWNVNLLSGNFIISDKGQIDTITQLLRKVNLSFPSHPRRVWETKMIFITTAKDTFAIEIKQMIGDFNGTVIQTPTNKWKTNELGSYLEKVTNYRVSL